MRIPRYWSKASAEAHTPRGTRFPILLWRASEHSQADAEQRARAAAERMAERVRRGEPLPCGYGYADRPLKEEVVREILNRSGEVEAFLSRNSYGALVLNTAAVMFIDVDVPREPWTARLRRKLGQWWGRSQPSLRAETQTRITAWSRAHPGLGARLYETAAGFRLLITSRTFSPTSGESLRLLESAGADPLYIRLCKAQESFRARLSPKPWRCGVIAPPHQFPWESAEEKTEIRRWEQRYEAACASYATCRLIEQFGSGAIAPEVQPILGLHDPLTQATETLPLA